MKNLSAGQALHRVEAWLMNGRSGSRAAAWLDEFSTVGVDSAEDARAEFVDLWAKIKFPPGCSPLETALERAKECRLVPADCPTDGYADFISLAGHLQALRGPNMILLPCHKLGRLLGLSHMTIARSREWAVKDGHLRITRAHKFGSHEATEFRFDVSRYAAISRATSGLPNRTPRRLAAFWPAITRSRMMVLSSSATAPSTMKTILPAGVDPINSLGHRDKIYTERGELLQGLQ